MNQHNQDTIKPIYIRQLFESKNPRLARKIPSFIYKILQNIICQDRVNDFISRHGHRRGLDFAAAILEYLDIHYNVQGAENLPSPDGRYIFVSNHALGGPDGIILIDFLGRRYSPLKFPVNDLLMNLKNLNNIFIPVNKHGALARQAAIDMDAAYASPAQIITFPAGMVSRKHRGIIRDPEWQKNFITQAIRHHRDIIPIHFIGRNSNFFYNLANLRTGLGIKVNLEMMYLPRETFNKQGATFTLRVGTPIPWQTLDDTRTPRQWAQTIKNIVYNI